MFRKSLCMLLALSLYCCTSRTAFAQMNSTTKDVPTTVKQNTKEDKFAEKVKARIRQLGAGPDARVEVKLRDKTKLKGYVGEIAEDHVVIIDESTRAATNVPYPQVKQVKGNNLSTGAKIAIGALAVWVIIGLVQLAKNPAP